jgi:hypothetical protein
VTVKGIDQPGQFGQRIGHLATCAGANPQTVSDVYQGPPAVPFCLDAPICLISTRLAGCRQHRLEEREWHGPEYSAL